MKRVKAIKTGTIKAGLGTKNVIAGKIFDLTSEEVTAGMDQGFFADTRAKAVVESESEEKADEKPAKKKAAKKKPAKAAKSAADGEAGSEDESEGA